MYKKIPVLNKKYPNINTHLHLVLPLFVFSHDGQVLFALDLLLLEVGLDLHHHGLLSLHTPKRQIYFKTDNILPQLRIIVRAQ